MPKYIVKVYEREKHYFEVEAPSAELAVARFDREGVKVKSVKVPPLVLSVQESVHDKSIRQKVS